jgi:hypothetical protein
VYASGRPLGLELGYNGSMETKPCNKCGVEKSVEQFQVALRTPSKTYYRKYCTSCKMLQQKARNRKVKNIYLDYKKSVECHRCGIADYRVIDFHHTDASTKTREVADMVAQNHSWENIKLEIDKCVPLCSNCHRITHWKDYI